MSLLGRIIDNAIAVFAPQAAADRTWARVALDQAKRYLDAGKRGRTQNTWTQFGSSGDIPDIAEVQRSRMVAWDLVRNNPYVKKGVNVLQSQICGISPKPQSLAVDANGESFEKFRVAALKLWEAVNRTLYYRDRPGSGGMTRDEMIRQVIPLNALSGECLLQRIPISSERAKEIGSPIQIQFDLIEGERLDDTMSNGGFFAKKASKGKYIYRGIEYDDKGSRIAYHILSANPDDPKSMSAGQSEQFPAKDIIHAFVKTGPAQSRGLPWLAAGSTTIKQINDCIDNMLMAMAVQSCATLVIKRTNKPTVPLSGFAPALTTNTTDDNGNKYARLQPGTLMDIGAADDVSGFSPNVYSGDSDNFVRRGLLGLAASLPGVKSSTITGDYRESSFSSERSADNDCWRETEVMQNWLFDTVCQPLWEMVIEAGFASGWFEKEIRLGYNLGWFRENKQYVLPCDWEGPVAKSINPAVDEVASEKAIANGTSNVDIENRTRGMNYKHTKRGQAEVLAHSKELAKEFGIPIEWLEPTIAKFELAKMALKAKEQAAATVTDKGNAKEPAKDSAAKKSFESNGHVDGNRLALTYFVPEVAV